MSVLVSVYTPTNSLVYLEQAWQSLQRQTYRRWEWILVPNGDLTGIPSSIADDPRVRVFAAPDCSGNVGALKRFACEHAQGDLLVELDHDDILMDTCLQRLVESSDTQQAQFLYSDFASVSETMQPLTYSPVFGWSTYNVLHEGRLLKASRAFETNPSSLMFLQFSPNHARAWTRRAYLSAGGYSDKFSLADDYDLLLRTYLDHTPFIHIPECLYIYRVHNSAASRRHNTKIQELQNTLANAHFDRILAEWCRRIEKPGVELAISTGQRSGMQTAYPLRGVEQTADGYLFPGLSDLPESSVGQLICRNMLPYLDRQLIIPFFEACYRALVPGGWLRCAVPTTSGAGAFANPIYRSYWNQATFRTFCSAAHADLAGGHKCRFQYARVWDSWYTEVERQQGLITTFADLVALKGQKQAGAVEI
jgi:glycosyltransferase involved in cell wall biosynthesis